jgi:hypothetical protein
MFSVLGSNEYLKRLEGKLGSAYYFVLKCSKITMCFGIINAQFITYFCHFVFGQNNKNAIFMLRNFDFNILLLSKKKTEHVEMKIMQHKDDILLF